MSENQEKGKPMERPVSESRRRFLKRMGVMASGAGLSFLGTLGTYEAVREKEGSYHEENYLKPRIEGGVEVFGLSEEIKTEEQILNLYRAIDKKFEEKNGIIIQDKPDQRKELLPPEDRYLEVVVSKSAYDSFVRRKQETGVDFTGWIKAHVELMNKTMEAAKPPAEIRARLRRIMVISDDISRDISCNSQLHCGKLDSNWLYKFTDSLPLDTDTSWAIDADYRLDRDLEKTPGYFWMASQTRGEVVLRWPPFAKESEREFVFPTGEKKLFNGNILIDWGMVHEWMHRLLNLPDEYRFDASDVKVANLFRNFIFDSGDPLQTNPYSTTGSYSEPHFSPYLSYLMERNIKEGVRGFLTTKENKTYDYHDRPDNVGLTFTAPDDQIRKLFIRSAIIEDKFYREPIVFSNRGVRTINGSSVELGPDDFDDRPGGSNLYFIQGLSDKKWYELYLPTAAFNMSKVTGLRNANYKIEIIGTPVSGKRTLVLHMVDESDLDKYEKLMDKNKETIYAKMKVEGTNTWFYWLIRGTPYTVNGKISWRDN